MLYLNTHIEGTGNKAEAFLLLILCNEFCAVFKIDFIYKFWEE